MNELQVFSKKELGCVRVVNIDGQPWFIGKDVAEILGYEAERNAIRQHVDDDDKLTHQISASGQNRNMILINESGLYSLILSSKLPKAKTFKRWVTSEVLPAIRQTGSYSYTEGTVNNLVSAVVQQVTANIMKELPQMITGVVSGFLPVKPDNPTPAENQLGLSPLDWKEIAFWEDVLTQWRDYRCSKVNKAQVDKEFLHEFNQKNPEMQIGRRTLYRKWKCFTEQGAMGLLDRRGKHGNHRRKTVTEIVITQREAEE